MAYQMAQTPVTLNDLEGFSFSFRAIQMQVIYICTAEQFTRFQLARSRRAVPQRQLGFLLIKVLLF